VDRRAALADWNDARGTRDDEQHHSGSFSDITDVCPKSFRGTGAKRALALLSALPPFAR